MRVFSVLASALLCLSSSSLVAAQNCILMVPLNPLGVGLSMPFIQSGTCTQAGGTTSFVQGAILNLDSGAISVYNPLVIDVGTKPATPPTVPVLPKNYVAGLWFGTNGNTLTLAPTPDAVNGFDSLVQGSCVNGGGNDWTIFGQFAACNAKAFFDAANRMILAGKLTVPKLGNDFQGNVCPTTRDFGLVDQDQSDNTVTKYLLTTNNLVAQWTPTNVLKFPNAQILFNGSDEALIVLVSIAINCTVWVVPDLADPTGTQMVPSLPTNELQARYTITPTAFVPLTDPMVLNGNTGLIDYNKMNAYRVNVNQEPTYTLLTANPATYCQNLYAIGAVKIAGWLSRTVLAASPAATSATLGQFLVQRYLASVGPMNLNCTKYIAGPVPLSHVIDNAGNINLIQGPGQTLAMAVGSVGYVPNHDGDLQDPSNVLAATPSATAPQAATGTINNGAATTTTVTSTTAFSIMWFGIGIGTGIFVILLGEAVWWAMKRRETRSDVNRNSIRATL